MPITGVGFQMHVDPRHWPSADQIRKNIERYAALGLAIEITEMDVPVGALPGDINEKLQGQREITHDIVAACVAVDKCSGHHLLGRERPRLMAQRRALGPAARPRPALCAAVQRRMQAKPMVAGIIDALEAQPPRASARVY